MSKEHRKWVGADISPALFSENDINGSALRSVDDVRAQLWDHTGFCITSASCGHCPAQVVKAVVSSSFAQAARWDTWRSTERRWMGRRSFSTNERAAGPQHRVGLPQDRADVV